MWAWRSLLHSFSFHMHWCFHICGAARIKNKIRLYSTVQVFRDIDKNRSYQLRYWKW